MRKEEQRKKNYEDMKRSNQISFLSKQKKTQEKIEKALMNDNVFIN